MWGRYIDNIATRVGQMVRHGQVVNAFDESTGLARGQVKLSDIETYDKVPHVQHYGFASSPPIGAAVMLQSSSGDFSQSIIVATHDPRHRPVNMVPGEVQVYDASGNSIYLSTGADGLLIRASGQVTIVAPKIEVRGDMHVTGTITCDNDVVAGGNHVSLVHHRHQAQGPTSITSPPV